LSRRRRRRKKESKVETPFVRMYCYYRLILCYRSYLGSLVPDNLAENPKGKPQIESIQTAKIAFGLDVFRWFFY
jgi:hypothetical protein